MYECVMTLAVFRHKYIIYCSKTKKLPALFIISDIGTVPLQLRAVHLRNEIFGTASNTNACLSSGSEFEYVNKPV